MSRSLIRGVPGSRFCPARKSLLVAQRFPVVSLREIPAEDPGMEPELDHLAAPGSPYPVDFPAVSL
jgi:hypothetical protein